MSEPVSTETTSFIVSNATAPNSSLGRSDRHEVNRHARFSIGVASGNVDSE